MPGFVYSIARNRFGAPSRVSAPARPFLLALFFTLLMGTGACRHSAADPDPVTLSYIRLGWFQPDELPNAEPLSQKFTRETGIQLKSLPVPENTLDQLDLSRKLLRGQSGPDVLGIDVIWPGVLADELMDLRPYLPTEISLMEPTLLSNYTADGKVLAIPYQGQVGVLEYRTDLLREYGYDHPPRTWDELETMAQRIQSGERAKGKKDFWGYVWQGAASEALTCNALEWQASQGGGQIIENDRTVSVNNPAAIRAWQRARQWIGRISPPSVLAFHEFDSTGIFDSGQAAFNRVWGWLPMATTKSIDKPHQLHWRSTMPVGKTGYTSMPGGTEGRAGTLGGSGLALSQKSVHPQEAVSLVRFMIQAQMRFDQESLSAELPDQPEVHELPSGLNLQGNSEKPRGYKTWIVSRPSTVTGHTYEQVTRAYFTAVHAVLAGEKSAAAAAAELEKQLIAITGFRSGPPKAAE